MSLPSDSLSFRSVAGVGPVGQTSPMKARIRHQGRREKDSHWRLVLHPIGMRGGGIVTLDSYHAASRASGRIPQGRQCRPRASARPDFRSCGPVRRLRAARHVNGADFRCSCASRRAVFRDPLANLTHHEPSQNYSERWRSANRWPTVCLRMDGSVVDEPMASQNAACGGGADVRRRIALD